jgi:hypothetical protein
MTGVLVWKVYREQRLIWLVMAVLAAGVFVVDLAQAERGSTHSLLFLLFYLLADVYGMIVGASLLAEEREAMTAAFLDTLPATRLAVWRAKCACGVILVMAQVLILGSILLGAGAVSGVLVWGKLVCAGLVGLAWGLFFSGWMRTPLAAILAAALVQAAAAPLIIGLGYAWSKEWTSSLENSFVVFGLGMPLILGPLAASAVRQAWEGPPGVPVFRPASSPKWLGQLAALAWLEFHQNGRLIGWLAMAALVTGLLAAVGICYWPLLGLVGWPVLTLLVGVSFGIAAFAGEQAEGTGRFLADQRLPPGMVWAGKVGLYLVAAVAIALVVFLGAQSGLGILKLVREDENTNPLVIFDLLKPFLQLGPYFTLFLGYGFSVGCLCGLLFAKRVVAGFVALAVTLLLTALWLPSLLFEGLHAWQIWGAPILLLLTTRLLIPPWATNQLGSARSLVSLTGSLLLAGLWLTGALAYRVIEVPPFNYDREVAAYQRDLETAERNDAIPRLAAAFRQLDGLMGDGERRKLAEKLFEADFRGWPIQDPEFDALLDRVFREPWARELATVVQQPADGAIDLRNCTLWTQQRLAGQVIAATDLLIARGLQLQARGDPAAFLDHLATGLTLARRVRRRDCLFCSELADTVERSLRRGLDRWQDRLGKESALARRALALLLDHERVSTFEEDDSPSMTDYLVLLNSMDAPEACIPRSVAKREMELAGLVNLALQTPWEQARLRRIVFLKVGPRVGEFHIPRSVAGLHYWLDGCFCGPPRDATRMRTWRVAHDLMAALRIYQAEMGKPAQTLQELAPGILKSVPVDPVSGEPFTYRLSRGEEIRIGKETSGDLRKVPAGQGILTTHDRTFLVPLSPGKEAKP